jgi:AraC-like DNA-binding protein
MILQKFDPTAPLSPFIKEYTLIESEQDFSNTILPNVGIVLSFRYQGDIMVMENDQTSMLPAVVLSGLRKSARQVTYHKGASNLLVTFKEGGITAFSQVRANELFGLSVDAAHVFPTQSLLELLEKLALASGHALRIQQLEAFLLKHLKETQPDLVISHVLEQIKASQGLTRIKDLAQSVYLSQDAFEKRFRARIGSTPRQFASIIRLQQLIRQYPHASSLTEASYEAGYFDQSHFIKDFRIFTGQTPSQFFKSVQLW